MSTVDVNRIIEGLRRILDSSKPPSVQLRFELGPNLPLLNADPGQIEQIVVALVANAFDALIGKSGQVIVRTGLVHLDVSEREGFAVPISSIETEYAFIEVEDTGGGIEPEIVPRIFEPFFTTRFTGRGLGLASVAGVVRSHLGGVKLHNIPGTGCKFTVYLPAARDLESKDVNRPGRRSRKEKVSRQSGGRARERENVVLFAEDDADVRKVIRRLMERAGYRVIEATDGVEAVEQFRRHGKEIHGIVLDLAMPRMDGLEALRLIRNVRPGIPVIVSTGYHEKSLMGVDATQLGIVFLQKPYEGDVLLEVLRKALRRKT
jgi:CheY-like chemotaxis protein